MKTIHKINAGQLYVDPGTRGAIEEETDTGGTIFGQDQQK